MKDGGLALGLGLELGLGQDGDCSTRCLASFLMSLVASVVVCEVL